MNNNTGLGLPSYILSNEEIADSILENLRLERFLLKKFHEAIHSGAKEVVITDSDIENHIGDRSKSMIPPISLELFCEILAKDQTSIDQGNFHLVLSPSQLSQQLGSAFGRFLHVLPKEAKNALSEAYVSEQKLHKVELKGKRLYAVSYICTAIGCLGLTALLRRNQLYMLLKL